MMHCIGSKPLSIFFNQKTSFGSKRLFSSVKIKTNEFKFKNVDNLVNRWSEIKNLFNKKGYVILTPPNEDETLVLKVCSLFGKIQGHTRAIKNGIVEIRSEALKKQGNHVISNLAFTAHTDGAYLEGIANKGNKAFHVSPPKIVALQCVKPAPKGGESFLVDGGKILNSLINHQSEITPLLFSRECMHISRENHLVMNLPVFKRLPSGHFEIRFSYDKDLYTSITTLEKLTSFNKDYILNPKFSTRLLLSKNQIFVFDNHRYLHGRTSFEGERLLRRIWIQDEELSSEMTNPEGLPYFESTKALTVLGRYDAYVDLHMPFTTPKVEKVHTGIELSQTAKKKLERILRRQINQ